MATVNIMTFFLPNQYYLKCNYSGIHSIKLFTRNQYRVSNQIQVSIAIVEIWYRIGTRLMHGTCSKHLIPQPPHTINDLSVLIFHLQ